MNYKDLQQPVLFFDGVCNLCSAAVQFIMQRDSKQQFMFASLQSKPGMQAIQETGMTGNAEPGSIILYYKGHYYLRSAAMLKIARLLGGIWPVFSVLYILPAFLRNAVYNLIARNRYRWFGRKNECMVPAPQNMKRFLQ